MQRLTELERRQRKAKHDHSAASQQRGRDALHELRRQQTIEKEEMTKHIRARWGFRKKIEVLENVIEKDFV